MCVGIRRKDSAISFESKTLKDTIFDVLVCVLVSRRRCICTCLVCILVSRIARILGELPGHFVEAIGKLEALVNVNFLSAEKGSGDDPAALKAQVEELQKKVAEQEKEIAELKKSQGGD